MNEGQIPNNLGGVPPYQVHYERPRKRSNWWIPLLVIGIIIALVITFFAVIFGMVGSAFEKEQIVVKNNSVLFITLDGVQEYTTETPFQMFGSSTSKANFFEIITSIKRAKTDNNIKGIFYSVKSEQGLSTTKAAELQDVLADFKSSGKFIYSYIQSGTDQNYYNALPSDKIYMPEEGMLEMNGFAINAMFFKNTLNSIGVDFYVQQFEDFKSAGESFSRTKFSDSARYQLKVLLQSRFDTFVNSIEKFRKIKRDDVVSILNRGIYTADSLKSLGFIDEILPEDQVKEMMKKKVFGRLDKQDELSFVSLNKYAASEDNGSKKNIASKDKQIAIIYAVGAISQGRNAGWSNEESVRSESFIEYLRKAREDKSIKAIILRIDSPGGSVIASDDIFKEILKTREVKPVYASMSDVAASGGYYMAMACDTIIAHPTTITGSIGVILMVNNFSRALGKLDITIDTIATGDGANFLSPLSPLRDGDKAQLFSMSEKIYKRFVSKAAESRNKSFEEMRSLAKGRVWVGSDAKAKGLVDVEGGLLAALDIAKKRIGIDPKKQVYIKTFPSQEESLQSILKIFGVEDEEEPSVNMQSFAKAMGISFTDFIGYWSVLPKAIRQQMLYNYQLIEMAGQENTLMALPYYYELK